MTIPFRHQSLMPEIWLNTIHLHRPKHRRLMARARACVNSSQDASEGLRRVWISLAYSHVTRCGCGPWLWPPEVRDSLPEGAGL